MTDDARQHDIDIRRADIGPVFDRIIVALVLFAVLAAWLAEPGHPLAFAGFAGLLLLSWFVPRLLNARSRRASHRPRGLCAQARVDYLRPEALRIAPDHALQVRLPGESAFIPVAQVRPLHLGPLLHLAFAAAAPSAATSSSQPPDAPQAPSGSEGYAAPSAASAASSLAASGFSTLEIPPSVPITGREPSSSTDEGPQPLLDDSSGGPAPEISLRHGSCLLWLNRLPDADAAALRRWLLWRQRGGE